MCEADRDNEGKPELSYMLTFPNAWKSFAAVCMSGARKYSRGNYLKGAPLSQYQDCLLRHLLAWANGEDIDPDSKCHHLAHVIWNALCLLEMAITQPERDDRMNQKVING
tara:strand:- start:611 stop:940 length:330 start_codon:yes stop_codon:yes gene_type:complete